MTIALEWLNTKGVERQRAVECAAETLMADYRRSYRSMVPPELHRLASLIGAQISYVADLPGGARLLPVQGGFQILIDSTLVGCRKRTAIAHELVHTLFYSKNDSIPKRVLPPSRTEEHFCFDVARRILVPHWMIRSSGLRDIQEASRLFSTIACTFKLSRQMASRVLLQDYQLLSGVAAVWIKTGEQWRMKLGNCYASPDLSRRDRATLHSVARAWLCSEQKENRSEVIGSFDSTARKAFVLVVQKPSASAASA
jgi:hypothetical protein